MDTKNQQGGLVAKTKKMNQNPRKVMQDQINEIGGATSSIIRELQNINNHLIGMETLILNYAEFRGNKEEFIKFIEGKIEEGKKEKKDSAEPKAKNQSK